MFSKAGIEKYFNAEKAVRRDFWRGFGFTLATMALLAMAADYFAEKRANIYINKIIEFINKN